MVKNKAIRLKSELLRHFHYAFYHHPYIKKQVSKIGQNKINKHLSFDLLALANIAQKNASILKGINFDTELLKLAKQVSESLANNKIHTTPKDALLTRRDCAYTLLYQKITEIRKCGKYVFYKDEKKYNKYTSDYYKTSNSINRKGKI